jgi:hypothetical protein
MVIGNLRIGKFSLGDFGSFLRPALIDACKAPLRALASGMSTATASGLIAWERSEHNRFYPYGKTYGRGGGRRALVKPTAIAPLRKKASR